MAAQLNKVGRREEALTAAAEAAAIYRELAAQRPEVFRPYLAASLNNMANALSGLGRREAALAAAEEAVAIRRELAAAHPDAFRPSLARSLTVLASCLDASGRECEALSADREAIAALLPYFVTLPTAFADLMQATVQGYRRRCEKAGCEPDDELLAPILEVFQRMQGRNNDRVGGGSGVPPHPTT